jgi:hypothetical protein
MTAAQIGKIARPSARVTMTPDGRGAGFCTGLGDGFGDDDDGRVVTGIPSDTGSGPTEAEAGLYDDGGTYGGTGTVGWVGVLAKSCSETGGGGAAHSP